MERDWLIWSNEHAAWWAPGRAGYCRYLHDAGRYTHSEALDICTRALAGSAAGRPPNEIPIYRGAALLQSLFWHANQQRGEDPAAFRAFLEGYEKVMAKHEAQATAPAVEDADDQMQAEIDRDRN